MHGNTSINCKGKFLYYHPETCSLVFNAFDIYEVQTDISINLTPYINSSFAVNIRNCKDFNTLYDEVAGLNITLFNFHLEINKNNINDFMVRRI